MILRTLGMGLLFGGYCFLLLACGDEEEVQSPGDTGDTGDTGEGESKDTSEHSDAEEEDASEDQAGDNEDLGDLWADCGAQVREPVEWDAATDLELSPKEVFGGLAGSCSSTLIWDGGVFDEDRISPNTGKAEVTVTVALDESSAVQIKPEAATGDAYCDRLYLEITAVVTITTEDGTFSDTGEVTLRYSDDEEIAGLSFTVPLEEAGGTLAIDVDDGEHGELVYQLDGDLTSCAGSVLLTLTRSLGGGVASTGIGDLGTWSNSGCAAGAEPIDLSVPVGDDGSLIEQILDLWKNFSIAGTWDDGEKTTLDIEVEAPGASACAEPSGQFRQVLTPVDIRYGTADGRIVSHRLTADLELNLAEDGTLRASSLWIDDNQECLHEDDTLYYTLAGCDTLEGIMVQIGIQSHPDGEISVSDDGAAVYEYHREGDAPPGAADEVRTLELEP